MTRLSRLARLCRLARLARPAAVAVLPACLLLASCSRDDAPGGAQKVIILGGRPGPRAPTASDAATPPSEPPSSEGDPAPPRAPTHVAFATVDAAPFTYGVKVKADAQPAEDPDLAVVVAGRASASGCFTGITDGSTVRSASIHVTVIPSGSVTRVEVSAPSTSEPWILSCLEGVGNGLRFADKPKADIRSFAIDVTVGRAH